MGSDQDLLAFVPPPGGGDPEQEPLWGQRRTRASAVTGAAAAAAAAELDALDQRVGQQAAELAADVQARSDALSAELRDALASPPPARRAATVDEQRGSRRGGGSMFDQGSPTKPASKVRAADYVPGRTRLDIRLLWQTTGWGFWGRILTAALAVVILAVPLAALLWAGNAYFTTLGIGQLVGWVSTTTGLGFFAAWWAAQGMRQYVVPVAFSATEVGWNPLFQFFPTDWYQRAFSAALCLADFGTTWSGLSALALPAGDWLVFFQDGGLGQLLGTVVLTAGPEVVIILGIRSIMLNAVTPVRRAWAAAQVSAR